MQPDTPPAYLMGTHAGRDLPSSGCVWGPHRSKKTAATAGRCCLCLGNQSACSHTKNFSSLLHKHSCSYGQAERVQWRVVAHGCQLTLRMFNGPLGAVIDAFFSPAKASGSSWEANGARCISKNYNSDIDVISDTSNA